MEPMKRALEADLSAWIIGDDPRPVLIQGARRVGKTFLAERCGARLFGRGFAKVDFQTDLERASAIFDGPTDDIERIVARISEYKRTPLHPATSLILLDEVQLCEKALNSLRFFAQSPWRVVATGSLLGVAVRQRRLPFPSDVKHVRMYPLTFEEFLWALGEEAMANDIRSHCENCDPYLLHDRANEYFQRYLTVGGMPKAVRSYRDTGSFDEVREAHEEIDITFTADMTDPDNGISAAAAKRIWESLPKQLLRASTKKFKYSEVMRGGRRTQLLEPLEWLEAAGVILRNNLTCDTVAPLSPFNDDEGSFFKEYICDTGLMFHKFGIEAELFLDPKLKSLLSGDFRGALAENSVMQALRANGLSTFYWMPNEKVGQGEVDFVFQDRAARVVPVEVKSGRNVKARSLSRLISDGRADVAYLLSEGDFAETADRDTGCTVKHLPLYAAFCIGQ
ncbi:MAG: ATP-binding protein [Eggerthellaceae bacterium]|nr:ATP-binding protein [Eggerthellaceae bacterium]